MTLYNQKTITHDVSFYSSQEHTDKRTTASTRAASVHPTCQIVRDGTVLFLLSAGLGWHGRVCVCVCVCECKASLIFHKRDGLEFPLSAALTSPLPVHTRSSPPLPAAIITTSCNQSPEQSLALFFIPFASLSLLHSRFLSSRFTNLSSSFLAPLLLTSSLHLCLSRALPRSHCPPIFHPLTSIVLNLSLQCKKKKCPSYLFSFISFKVREDLCQWGTIKEPLIQSCLTYSSNNCQ